MKLLYSPGACSIGIHVLLEEIGAPYERQRINFAAREQYGEAFTAISPKSKVPVLIRDDGRPLTEFGAVATYLARKAPHARLLPDDPDEEAFVREVLDYVVGTIHGEGFRRIVRPGNYAAEAEHEDVRTRGREIFARGLALLDAAMEGRRWVGPHFSIGDAALFYVERWHDRAGVELPVNLRTHLDHCHDRGAVRRVLHEEGLLS